MAKFDSKTTQKLQASLPLTANIHNPVDVIGDALSDRYESALSAILPDTNVDATLVILTPQVMTEKEKTEKIIARFHDKFPKKPMLAAFMGGRNIEYAVEKLAEQGIPNFLYPGRAILALEAMVKLQNWRNQQRQTRSAKQQAASSNKARDSLRKEIQKERDHGNTQLSPKLAKKLLEQYDISLPDVKLAKEEEMACRYADELGYPVVLKIASDEILHKTDIGGVRLALKNEKELRKGYREIMKNVRKKAPQSEVKGVLVQKMYHFGREVIVGMKRDDVFGPMVMFGLGGVYVEVMKDVSFRVAPFGLSEAKKMIREVKAIKLLEGVRGEAPADMEKIAETILRIAQLSIDFPQIQELDMNPLLVMSKGKGVVAIDVRMIIGQTQ